MCFSGRKLVFLAASALILSGVVACDSADVPSPRSTMSVDQQRDFDRTTRRIQKTAQLASATLSPLMSDIEKLDDRFANENANVLSVKELKNALSFVEAILSQIAENNHRHMTSDKTWKLSQPFDVSPYMDSESCPSAKLVMEGLDSKLGELMTVLLDCGNGKEIPLVDLHLLRTTIQATIRSNALAQGGLNLSTQNDSLCQMNFAASGAMDFGCDHFSFKSDALVTASVDLLELSQDAQGAVSVDTAISLQGEPEKNLGRFHLADHPEMKDRPELSFDLE